MSYNPTRIANRTPFFFSVRPLAKGARFYALSVYVNRSRTHGLLFQVAYGKLTVTTF